VKSESVWCCSSFNEHFNVKFWAENGFNIKKCLSNKALFLCLAFHRIVVI